MQNTATPIQPTNDPSHGSDGSAGNDTFRELCAEHGIAVTQQRQVLYETLESMHGHPSPEEVYAAVKQRIPSISLATVYKNIHLFVESGVLRELSMHHGTLRVEMNSRPHYHLVCSNCKQVTDCEPEDLGLPAHVARLENGFAVQRLSVDVIGLCQKCQAERETHDRQDAPQQRPN